MIDAPVETLPEIPVAPFDRDRIYSIPMKAIFADEDWNCRGFIDPTNVLELARDIRAHGLQFPVLVAPSNERAGKPFKLVAGYRRYKAHQLNSAESIRVMIRENLSEQDARILNLTENLQRQDLNMKQEAHAITKLRFLRQDDIANRINKSRGWVQVRLALLELPEDLQDEAAAGRLTNNEVMKCARLPSTDQMYEYVRKVKDRKLLGKKREIDPEKIRPKSEKRLRTSREIEEMQDLIRRAFGNGVATRCLGWAGGYIDDKELYAVLQQEAAKIGKFFAIPEGLD